jgi:hypothetical protein
MVHLHALTRLRLQLDVEHLHALDPRAVAEFLVEVDHRIGGMPAVLGLLAEFERRLAPGMLRATGGDRFPQLPLHLVPPL